MHCPLTESLLCYSVIRGWAGQGVSSPVSLRSRAMHDDMRDEEIVEAPTERQKWRHATPNKKRRTFFSGVGAVTLKCAYLATMSHTAPAIFTSGLCEARPSGVGTCC